MIQLGFPSGSLADLAEQRVCISIGDKGGNGQKNGSSEREILADFEENLFF